MNNLGEKLTGISLPKEGFKLHETHKSVDVNSVFQVLNGNLAAYRIREFIPDEACNRIVDNFWTSSEKVPRYGYGDGEDGVEGYFLGASHIEKSTVTYLEEARAFSGAVERLYTGTVNPIAIFRDALISQSDRFTNIRPAKSNELSAGDSKAVYWSDLGDFLLKPHDDYAQTKDPRQKEFEIQEATRIMAINFYAEVPKNAGQLKIWNIEPDDKTRSALNLTYSGFPYPAELLEDFNNIIIPVEAGDLCVIHGNLVHAVTRGDPSISSKKRLLITCFMAFNNKNELIWWT